MRSAELHVGADAVGHHLFSCVGTEQVLVKVGQVRRQLQVLLLHSPVADAVAAVA